MTELYVQTALDFLFERTQMMHTDETHFYRHEIGKLMGFDDSNLSVYPLLDSSIKTKYLGLSFNFTDVARHNQKVRGP